MSSPPADAAGVMAGGGDYRNRSETQHEAAAVGYPLVASAVDSLAGLAPTSEPAVLADFGAASGNNSLRPLTIALDRLDAAQAAAPGRRAVVVHTDLPGNDFRTLFDVVEHDAGSYLVGRDGVVPLVAGRSFYERIFPSSSLWFGWSASSLHWLSAAPGPSRTTSSSISRTTPPAGLPISLDHGRTGGDSSITARSSSWTAAGW